MDLVIRISTIILFFVGIAFGFMRQTSTLAQFTSRLQSKKALSMVASIESLTPDGCVQKELISNGFGKAIEPGDILAVQYEAFVNGKVFAKGEKEQFVFKDGSHIKGWDIAVGSMKIGETSRFFCKSNYAYGSRGIESVIPPDAEVEIAMNVLAWLGNQLRPESLFQKDLDIDPFVASTPEKIQAEYDDMQIKKMDKYQGGIFKIYLNRIKNISFGFGGSNFFASQSGEKAPWYLNPNITFPSMITVVLALFITVLQFGGIKEKGERPTDLDVATRQLTRRDNSRFIS